MFTGIVEAVGRIARIQALGGDWRLCVRSGGLDLTDVRLGDSIAVNGACLTVTSLQSGGFSADVSSETIACTAFSALRAGHRVNLEKALTLSARLGGHLVSGHVDGVGEVISRRPDGRSQRIDVKAPADIARYIAAKGSICVNGVSLTVNAVDGDVFSLNVIPHTAGETTVDEWLPGAMVNLEVDLLARYLERLLHGSAAGGAVSGTGAREKTVPGSGAVTLELLARHGFLKQG
jgi:riboflavin synthase